MEVLADTHAWALYESQDERSRVVRPLRLSFWPAKHWERLVGVSAFLLALNVVNQAWAAPAYVSTPQGYALNARWGPGTNYGVYRKLWRGAALTTTGRYQNGWAQLNDGTWVAATYVQGTPLGSGGGAVGSDRTYAVVDTPPGYALNARWGPGENYGVYRKLAPGATLELTGRYQNGWAQLIDATWVASNYLRLTAAPAPGGTSPNTATPNPGTGQPPAPAADPQIVEVQNQLKLLGYLPFDFAVTGIYDAQTQDAVRRFQRVNGLVDDGILGPATLQALNNSTTGATPTSPAPNPQSTFDPSVAELQSQLKVLRYLAPEFVTSGVYDNQTREAVRTFQQVKGLNPNGVAGPETVQAINQEVRNLSSPSPSPNPSPNPSPDRSPNPTQTPNPSPSPTQNPTPNPTAGAGQQARVATDGEDTLVFSGPGPEYSLVGTLQNGTVVTTTGRTSGNWSELSDGSWIFSLWLQPVQSSGG